MADFGRNCDSDSDREMDLDHLPENRRGAHIEERTNDEGTVDEGTNHEQEIGKYNYSTTDRLDHRYSLWTKYMENTSAAKAFPAAHEYLYSNDPPQDKSSVEYMIWGDDEKSLQSLHSQLKAVADSMEPLREELNATIRGDGGKSLESLRQELKAKQDELENLRNDKSFQVIKIPDENTNLNEPKPDASVPFPNTDLTLNERLPPDVLEYFRRFQEEKEREHSEKVRRLEEEARRKDREHLEAVIKEREAVIKEREAVIKEREACINTKLQHIKERETRIEETLQHIKKNEALIKKSLQSMLERHNSIKNILVGLSAKGNETTGTALRTASLPPERFEESTACQPSPTKTEDILSSQSDKEFLTELLNNEIHQDKKNELTQLQTLVAKIMKHCDDAKVHPGTEDVKLNKSVDEILTWTTATRVTSSNLQKNYARPPSHGCETTADQPMLYALIYKILTIIHSNSVSLSSEQYVASIVPSERKRGRKIDFIVEEYREFLHVRFPEMLGRVIEVKSTSDDAKGFRKNQQRARDQVLGHLTRQLLCAFDFGGIGQDTVVSGIVLSMFSVQVLELKLVDIGTENVDIKFRQTAHVPLLGKTVVPDEILNDENVEWDKDSNGVLLLAGALLDLQRQSLFDSGTKHTIYEVSNSADQSSDGQEHRQCDCIPIGRLLGSGSFCHVVVVSENEFMKIPRAKRMVQSLKRECKMLGMLEPDQYPHPVFPKIVPSPSGISGVTVVKLKLRNEISLMEVLRLKGIVGSSLRSHCENNDKELNGVIQQVYDALVYAHSKNVCHMDVRPSNIIVKPKAGGGLDVLLADWGCSMLKTESIAKGAFVGCPPYAHDLLLGARTRVLKPTGDFDFASLGFTWYHVSRKQIDWQFDRPNTVSDDQKGKRKEMMKAFLKECSANARKRNNNIPDLLISKLKAMYHQR